LTPRVRDLLDKNDDVHRQTNLRRVQDAGDGPPGSDHGGYWLVTDPSTEGQVTDLTPPAPPPPPPRTGAGSRCGARGRAPGRPPSRRRSTCGRTARRRRRAASPRSR